MNLVNAVRQRYGSPLSSFCHEPIEAAQRVYLCPAERYYVCCIPDYQRPDIPKPAAFEVVCAIDSAWVKAIYDLGPTPDSQGTLQAAIAQAAGMTSTPTFASVVEHESLAGPLVHLGVFRVAQDGSFAYYEVHSARDVRWVFAAQEPRPNDRPVAVSWRLRIEG